MERAAINYSLALATFKLLAMNYRFLFTLILLLNLSCNQNSKKEAVKDNVQLAQLFDNYYEQRLKLFPREATQNGDNRYNDKLPVDFTDGYRDTLKKFYTNYLDSITKYNRDELSENDKVSFDIFKREMEIKLEDFKFPDNYMPANQFWGLHLTMGQLGNAGGNQPFKTMKDYSNWQSRVNGFTAWIDSAVIYFRKGINAGIVLPKPLVEKMLPQMRAMGTNDITKSVFLRPDKQIAGFIY